MEVGAMIETTKGLMDESLLEKREGIFEDDNEYTTSVEYWLADEMVHRSAHVTIKQGFIGAALTGNLGG